MAHDDDETTIFEMFDFLLRHYALIVFFALIGTAAGATAAYLSERPYTATISFELPNAETFLPNEIWRAAYLSETASHIDPQARRISATSTNPILARNLAEAARVSLILAAHEAVQDFNERHAEQDTLTEAMIAERNAAGRLERWAIQLEGTPVVLRQTGATPLTLTLMGTAAGAALAIVIALLLAGLARRRRHTNGDPHPASTLIQS